MPVRIRYEYSKNKLTKHNNFYHGILEKSSEDLLMYVFLSIDVQIYKDVNQKYQSQLEKWQNSDVIRLSQYSKIYQLFLIIQKSLYYA